MFSFFYYLEIKKKIWSSGKWTLHWRVKKKNVGIKFSKKIQKKTGVLIISDLGRT